MHELWVSVNFGCCVKIEAKPAEEVGLVDIVVIFYC